MKKKLVSIVLPAYNESGNIDIMNERINSCFPHDRYDLEVIFVDDGSTDDTLQKIETTVVYSILNCRETLDIRMH